MRDYLVFLAFVLISIALLCISFVFLLPLIAGLVALLIFRYEVLGLMPIDTVVDAQDKVVLLCPSFDY